MIKQRIRAASKIAALTVGVALGALTLPTVSASAQMYLGWDFGNCFGIGVGQVPSAYSPCPTYGWPWAQPCAYRR
jgi:hypothetical protein